jgi:hypothetical protein
MMKRKINVLKEMVLCILQKFIWKYENELLIYLKWT